MTALDSLGRSFTSARGRPAIFWQTQKTAQAASLVHVGYSDVPVVFVGPRKLTEEWVYRYLLAATEDQPRTASIDEG